MSRRTICYIGPDTQSMQAAEDEGWPRKRYPAPLDYRKPKTTNIYVSVIVLISVLPGDSSRYVSWALASSGGAPCSIHCIAFKSRDCRSERTSIDLVLFALAWKPLHVLYSLWRTIRSPVERKPSVHILSTTEPVPRRPHTLSEAKPWD